MKKTDEIKKRLVSEERHDLSSLRDLVEVLRSEEGCPWDREQTHGSIRADFIEETYEVIEAIDNDDPTLLREELGDVLFQIMFHSRIEEESGHFTIDEVINDICEKMIVRHPHVFADTTVSGTGEVLENWDKLKAEEKSRLTVRQSMEAVPRQLPTLMRVRKIAKKARKDGYDFGDLEKRLRDTADALSKVSSEVEKEGLLCKLIFDSATYAAVLNGADTEKTVGELLDRFVNDYKSGSEQGNAVTETEEQKNET